MSATSFPTRFDSTLDLARLPWFEVRGGNRLVMTDEAMAAVGPIIDMHTHLAMGFFRRLRIDLHAETPTAAYYLPVTLPVDLDAYSNTNLDRAAMFAMKADVSVLGLSAGALGPRERVGARPLRRRSMHCRESPWDAFCHGRRTPFAPPS